MTNDNTNIPPSQNSSPGTASTAAGGQIWSPTGKHEKSPGTTPSNQGTAEKGKAGGAQQLGKPPPWPGTAELGQLSHAQTGNQDVVKFNPLQQKQRRARAALKKLREPPKEIRPDWTPDHPRILSNNIKHIIDATRDPAELRYNHGKKDDDDNRRSEEEEPPLPTQTRQAQQAIPGQTGTSSQPASQGHKRQREEEGRASDEPDIRSITAENQRPLKRVKLRTGITQHVPEELATLRPQPLRLSFPPHPADDRSDAWFVEEFRKLFRRMDRFAQDYFARHDLDEGEFHQPWAADMSPEFLRYVEQVAEADPAVGGWDNLLRDTVQRKWLIVAVIMRILEVKVFGADLWGADAEEKEVLLGLEKALLTREGRIQHPLTRKRRNGVANPPSPGFSRNAVRSHMVRTIVGKGPVTKYFHPEVAQLTAQVALLFNPLSDFLYRRPPTDGRANPQMADQYQALHNIISTAAYLSICIRLSPTIFYFTALAPNTPYDPADQHSLESLLYTHSKAAVLHSRTVALSLFQNRTSHLTTTLARLQTAGHRPTSRIYRRAQAALDSHLRTQPQPLSRTHRALVKIAIWPAIRRFKPGSSQDERLNIPLETRDGFRIFDVGKAAAVFYYGMENRREALKGRTSLEVLARMKKRRYGEREPGVGRGVVLFAAAAAAAAVAGIPAALVYGEGFRRVAEEYLGGVFAIPSLPANSFLGSVAQLIGGQIR